MHHIGITKHSNIKTKYPKMSSDIADEEKTEEKFLKSTNKKGDWRDSIASR